MLTSERWEINNDTPQLKNSGKRENWSYTLYKTKASGYSNDPGDDTEKVVCHGNGFPTAAAAMKAAMCICGFFTTPV